MSAVQLFEASLISISPPSAMKIFIGSMWPSCRMSLTRLAAAKVEIDCLKILQNDTARAASQRMCLVAQNANCGQPAPFVYISTSGLFENYFSLF